MNLAKVTSAIMLLMGIVYFTSIQAYSQVVISEVMFDPLENENSDEFIEIYNTSETDSMDVRGWKISDGTGLDGIIDVGKGIRLAPKQFAVILDPDYFASSNTYQALIPPTALILTIDGTTFGSAGLSNTKAETVILIHAEGDTIAKYTYSPGNRPGYSDEKIKLTGLDTEENWADSKVLHGTPGSRNSVSPRNFDLGIVPEDISFDPVAAGFGSNVIITGKIRNLGIQAVSSFEVSFFEDANKDSIASYQEKIGSAVVGYLSPGDSAEVSQLLTAVGSGLHQIILHIEFPGDEDTTNNTAIAGLVVRFQSHDLIVNEIMYRPGSGQAEWVEFMNPASRTIDLQEWSFSDSNPNSRIIITESSLLVKPGEYVVIAGDSTILQAFPTIEAPLIIPREKFPALNNDYDSVVLNDLTGLTIDSVAYRSSWGGDVGISLERINPYISSADSSNWSSCVFPQGGTPGRQNSIFTKVVPTHTELSILPNPFSPDEDGRDDFTVINYQLPLTTAMVNIKIYDVRGRLVRTLFNNEPSGSFRSVIWDGKDDEGNVLRMGIYIVYLEALNSRAGVIKSIKKTVVLAGKL